MKTIGWGDESVKSANAKDDIFKLQAGRSDVIRILDDASAYFTHWVPEKNRYVGCSMDEYNECPACAKGYTRAQKYGCTILLIGEAKGKDLVKIGKIKAWLFGADKYVALKEIGNEYGDLKQLDLRITCTDSNFQRIGSILPLQKAARIDQPMIAAAKANILASKEGKDVLTRFIKGTAPQQIIAVLEGTTEEAAQLTLEDPAKGSDVMAAAPKAAAAHKAAPAAAPKAAAPVVHTAAPAAAAPAAEAGGDLEDEFNKLLGGSSK